MKEMNTIKLNLGSSDVKIDGFTNIDRKFGQEVYPLSYPENSVDEMRASHILEHFQYSDVVPVLTEWFNKLKPNGILKIAVPDFAKICEAYKNNTDGKVFVYTLGDQSDENNFHKSIFDEKILRETLEHVGFVDVKTWQDDVCDTSRHPISLRLCGRKPKDDEKGKVMRRISAVMSLPRLCFTDNITCIMRSVVSKGIPLIRSSGVFWGQCLTRLIQTEMKKDNLDYILTIDYDSWFTYQDIVRLMELLENNPEYDAVMPLQIKRENETPLVGIHPKEGQTKIEVSKEELEKTDIFPVDTGHFGLTVFRRSCFDKIKKPWFMPKPDENGEWGDNRVDEDIVFWNNFKESGCKLGLATKVGIGHIQLRVTYPDTIENGWRPVHLSIDEADKMARGVK